MLSDFDAVRIRCGLRYESNHDLERLISINSNKNASDWSKIVKFLSIL